jgi:hypothetical protein
MRLFGFYKLKYTSLNTLALLEAITQCLSIKEAEQVVSIFEGWL